MDFEVIETSPAPPLFKEIVMQEAQGFSTIEKVIIGADIVEMKGFVGSYFPEIKTIIIDMGSAMQHMTLYNKGMMYIPGVWITLLWALGHEVQHACQIECEPKLATFDTLPQEYEDGATEYGQEIALKWIKTHGVPPLEGMGWLNERLTKLLNQAYTKFPDMSDEPVLYMKGAVADINSVFALHEFTDVGRQALIEEIDAGNMGVKINDKRYLTAEEFLNL